MAHFVFLSAEGEDPHSPVPFLRAKGVTSARLRKSGMAYTVLVPNLFMDVWIPLVLLAPVASGRPVTIVGEGARKHYLVAVEDVGAFAVAAARPEPISAADAEATFGLRLTRLEDYLRRQASFPAKTTPCRARRGQLRAERHAGALTTPRIRDREDRGPVAWLSSGHGSGRRRHHRHELYRLTPSGRARAHEQPVLVEELGERAEAGAELLEP